MSRSLSSTIVYLSVLGLVSLSLYYIYWYLPELTFQGLGRPHSSATVLFALDPSNKRDRAALMGAKIAHKFAVEKYPRAKGQIPQIQVLNMQDLGVDEEEGALEKWLGTPPIVQSCLQIDERLIVLGPHTSSDTNRILEVLKADGEVRKLYDKHLEEESVCPKLRNNSSHWNVVFLLGNVTLRSPRDRNDSDEFEKWIAESIFRFSIPDNKTQVELILDCLEERRGAETCPVPLSRGQRPLTTQRLLILVEADKRANWIYTADLLSTLESLKPECMRLQNSDESDVSCRIINFRNLDTLELKIDPDLMAVILFTYGRHPARFLRILKELFPSVRIFATDSWYGDELREMPGHLLKNVYFTSLKIIEQLLKGDLQNVQDEDVLAQLNKDFRPTVRQVDNARISRIVSGFNLYMSSLAWSKILSLPRSSFPVISAESEKYIIRPCAFRPVSKCRPYWEAENSDELVFSLYAAGGRK